MPKVKAVNYKLIPEFDGDSGEQHDAYRLLAELRGKHHLHLHEARIALAWRYNAKADVDGKVMLGKCKKAGDLDRELADFDFVILLNHDAWINRSFGERFRRALLDHELMHAEVTYDARGDAKRDERGRIVYRTRRHDIEEFRDVVSRHGLYMEDVERFAAALRLRERMPLLAAASAPSDSTPASGPVAQATAEQAASAPPFVDLDGLPWYRWPVTELQGGPVVKLQFAGLSTLGALNMYLVNDPNLTAIPGITPEQAAEVRAALERVKGKLSGEDKAKPESEG